MKVLVTGGAGYIGTTTAKALEKAGHTPVILDSLVTGPRAFVGDRAFYEGDIADRKLLTRLVEEHPDIACTIHMAARIVVPESVAEPYTYYKGNVAKSLELFDQLVELGKPRVLFSSSASVYALADGFEVWETSTIDPPSPYARTKHMIEQVLTDLAAATDLRAIMLRYFNPIGADPELDSGVHIQEPTHVLGQLVMAARAVERFDEALEKVAAPSTVINVGTGTGVTVRELVAAFEKAAGLEVPIEESGPRPGDAIGTFANVDKARDVLQWTAKLSLEDGIESALAWAARRRDVLGYE